jgi:hypothetical protein
MNSSIVSRFPALIAVLLSNVVILPAIGQVAPATAPDSAAKRDETVVLSPFEVVSDTRGYFSANTMSGTRLNTKLEDLASSIAVITKEQMADFAMLDINDVFLYAGNTEGTGTYTEFNSEDGNGAITDSTAGDPANANRIRGIGNANVSVGNFESSNRVPIDPVDSDGVEISRGPNANIFGLGNASGTVNILAAAANVNRNRSTVAFRADSFDGYRGSIDLNRVLKKDTLALRVSAVRQRDGFDLKPSGVDTERYNGIVQFRPFKRTSINASYQFYRAQGNRPNSLPPPDGITDWRNAGAPTFDPVTDTRHSPSGATLGTALGGGGILASTPGFTHAYVEPSGMVSFTASTGISDPLSPLGAQQTTRRLVHTRAAVQDTQPLIARRTNMVSDRSVYDWSSINLNAANRFFDQTESTRVTVDHVVFDTGRQSLAAQFGWFREDSERFTRYIMADGATNGPTGQLVLDVNERLINGAPNPYFMRPFLQQVDPRPLRTPIFNDTYRGQLAYRIDFTGQRNLLQLLGTHNLVGYAEYKDKIQRSYRFFDTMIGDQSYFYNADGSRNPNQRVRAWYRMYVGDNQGQNIDYAPGNPTYGSYNFLWGNADTRVFRNDPVRLAEIATGSMASGSRSLQKTHGAILQSRLLGGALVPTFGVREDEHYTKFQNAARLTRDGLSYDYEYMNHWQPGDWQRRSGSTRQSGVVVKPLMRMPGLGTSADRSLGMGRYLADALLGLSLHYNRSDSFKPAAPAQNVFGQWLPDPAGIGKDYGFSLNMLDGKFVLRVNKYETKQINSRNGASAAFARVVWSMDYTEANFALQQEASAWISQAAAARGQTLTTAQLNAEVERVTGAPVRDRNDVNAIPVAETDDIVGRGHEIELHYNPTNYWTIMGALTEKRSINSQIAPNVSLYIDQRLPYWTTIVDPRTNTLWWTTLYAGAETPFERFRRTGANPLQIAKATEGLVRPQVRRYSANVSTNLRLSGITEHRILKRFNVGGAVRYESKGAIGYWGKQQLPAIITEYDINRPIWDKEHCYVDAFVGYRTKLWSDKIGATFQFNVRNLQEDGRLQPIAAGPDGKPNSYRIIAPRQFILSATFDL